MKSFKSYLNESWWRYLMPSWIDGGIGAATGTIGDIWDPVLFPTGLGDATIPFWTGPPPWYDGTREEWDALDYNGQKEEWNFIPTGWSSPYQGTSDTYNPAHWVYEKPKPLRDPTIPMQFQPKPQSRYDRPMMIDPRVPPVQHLPYQNQTPSTK